MEQKEKIMNDSVLDWHFRIGHSDAEKLQEFNDLLKAW